MPEEEPIIWAVEIMSHNSTCILRARAPNGDKQKKTGEAEKIEVNPFLGRMKNNTAKGRPGDEN